MAALLSTQADLTGPTPFRLAEAKYRLARALFEELPPDLESTDLAAFERAEDAFHAALDEVGLTPVSTWHEFADALEIITHGGEFSPNEDSMLKLLADARRLKAGGPA